MYRGKQSTCIGASPPGSSLHEASRGHLQSRELGKTGEGISCRASRLVVSDSVNILRASQAARTANRRALLRCVSSRACQCASFTMNLPPASEHAPQAAENSLDFLELHSCISFNSSVMQSSIEYIEFTFLPNSMYN